MHNLLHNIHIPIKNNIKIICILFVLSIFFVFAFIQKLDVTEYSVVNSSIPDSFNNYTIIQLSDLHYKNFGEHQSKLISLIKDYSPDLILLTGDMVDKNKKSFNVTEDLFCGIYNIAPIYCVSGNHEIYSKDIQDKMKQLYKKYGINYLENESVKIYANNQNEFIQLFGLNYIGGETDIKLLNKLKETLPKADSRYFSILLNHRTDIFDSVANYNYSLVLSGHTHGGIIRIPFLCGIIGNNGNLLPKYDYGTFNLDDSVMISSRGLGSTRGIPRIFNRPEVVVITLHN